MMREVKILCSCGFSRRVCVSLPELSMILVDLSAEHSGPEHELSVGLADVALAGAAA